MNQKTKQQKAVQYIALGIVVAFTVTIFASFIIH